MGIAEDRCVRKRDTYNETRKYWLLHEVLLENRINLLQLRISAIERLKLRREDIEFGKVSDVEMKLAYGADSLYSRYYVSISSIADDVCTDTMESVKRYWRRYLN